jgi:hypothetical protein
MGTECTVAALHFQAVARRTVQARFDGGTLTSDGGAVLLREVYSGLLQIVACLLGHYLLRFRPQNRVTLVGATSASL